jgi:hypothetical protein
MKRRDLLKAAGTFAAGTLIPGCSRVVSSPGAELSRRPNIIFVSVQADLTKLPVVLINDGTEMPFK